MPDEIVVMQTTDDTMTDANNKYINAIRVEYRVGQQGPFSVKIPKSQFTAERAMKEMQQFASELNKLPRAPQ
jgi:hypothetical protein